MTDPAAGNSSDLIASDRVEGTAVYNRAGERLGHISNFMVEKRSGQVRYALLSFGGFLGLGNDHYPIPLSMLSYDTDKSGYVVDLSKEVLDGAPLICLILARNMTTHMAATSSPITASYILGEGLERHPPRPSTDLNAR